MHTHDETTLSHRTPFLIVILSITLLFATGCGDDIHTVGLFSRTGRVQAGDAISIRGSHFGDEPGRVLIGGVEAEIRVTRTGYVLWNAHQIGVLISDHTPSGTIEVITDLGRRIRGPHLLVDQGVGDIDEVYERHIEEYALENEYGPDWVDWMLDTRPDPRDHQRRSHRDRYLFPFHRQRLERKRISIAYYYHQDTPYQWAEPWPGDNPILREVHHMQGLARMMEAAYPGYFFQINFQGDKRTHDLVVYANHPVDNQFIPGGEYDLETQMSYSILRCTNDGILVHEVGHFLGVEHHYQRDDALDSGQGLLMPPGDRSCTMDRSAGWCSACLAALDIDPSEYDRVRAEAAALEVLRHIAR